MCMGSCCCGACSLRNGCIAIAITMLVLNGIGAALLGLSLQNADLVRQRVEENPEPYFQGRTPTQQEIDELMDVSITLAAVSLAVVCLSLLFDLLLLAGAYFRKRFMVLAWAVWYSLAVLAMIAIGSYVLWATVEGDRTDSVDLLSYIVGAYVSAFIYICLIVVVVSYFRQLKNGVDGRGGYSPQSQVV